MTAASCRRARILRLRIIECRIAKARLAGADQAIVNLAGISARLDAFGSSLCVAKGSNNGQALLVATEMTSRLEMASQAMAAPIAEAQTRRAECKEFHIKSHQKQEGAQKLYDKAAREEAAAHILRSDANRPFRRLTKNWGAAS
jgi:hypothetical protein